MSAQLYDDYMREVGRISEEQALFKKVEIEVNVGCNRRCSYCFLATRRRETVIKTLTRTMRMELFITLLAQLRDLSFLGEINFHFYGEPLINPQLTTYARTTKSWLPKVSIVLYTNGDFLTDKKYRELRESGVSQFYITFHDNEIPEHVCEFIENADVVYDTRDTILLNNRGGYLGNNLHERVRNLPCIYPSMSIIVTIDGNVLPCSCDFDEEMCFGNIDQNHLAVIWNSDKAHIFRRDLLAGQRSKYSLCSGCDYYSSVVGLPSTAEASRNR